MVRHVRRRNYILTAVGLIRVVGGGVMGVAINLYRSSVSVILSFYLSLLQLSYKIPRTSKSLTEIEVEIANKKSTPPPSQID